jgi:integrase
MPVLDSSVHRLRMGELLALEWRDVDFTGEAIRVRRSYNFMAGSGPPRAARSDRYRWSLTWPSTSLGSAAVRTSSSPRILVFPGALGRFQDASSVRIRYQAALARAALRPLRFHDLRRTLAVRRAEVPAVQAWMGHADIQTTMRYVHHRDRGGEARLLAEAFATDVPIIPTLDVEA